MAVVSIKDTGIGISKENIELIFEEFRQVSEGDNRSFQGSGLGLTLTKKYLNLLNGKIEVESEVNVGTTFTIQLPLGNQSGNSEKSLAIKDGKKRNELLAPDIIKQKKVLLVENERINQLTIKKMLDSNFMVDCVDNSDEAINAVQTNDYDVILLDVNLGEGRNGIEIAKEIKKISDYNEKPIIAMTAYAMDKDKEEFLSSGFTHYIAKPFKRKELLDLLAKV
jgi:CheY-like chemotaxis protein